MSIDFSLNDYFTSNLYNGTNIPEGVIIEAVISGVELKEFKENGLAVTKVIIRLDNGKGIVLNQTRLGVIVDAFGPNPNNAIGKVIHVKRGMTYYQGKPTACVEIEALPVNRIESGGGSPPAISGPGSDAAGGGAAAAPPEGTQRPRGQTTVTTGRRKVSESEVFEDLERRRPDLNDEIPW